MEYRFLSWFVCTSVFLLGSGSQELFGQEYYYPSNGAWEVEDPAEMGWCTEGVDSLNGFLKRKNTKAFIVLHQGRIVLEEYYDSFTADSIWYWASAGKSLMGFMIGVTQDNGLLSINDPVSNYLGQGWSSCPPAKEALIAVRDQLSMTTGLEDQLSPTVEIPDPANCLEPKCLQYETDAGGQWAYHNAPYRLTQDVLEEVTGMNKTLYTLSTLSDLEFRGAWANYVFFSRPREMAKFGLLMLSEGKWAGKTLISDTAYMGASIRSSQLINPSYGYLWWLNGKGKYRLPGIDIDFTGSLIPDGPNDMYMALGKNDQRIYVVPSKDLVVIRMGNSASNSQLALSLFDNELWQYINDLDCPTNELSPSQDLTCKVYPNPCSQGRQVQIASSEATQLQVLDLQGNLLYQSAQLSQEHRLSLSNWAQGCYLVQLRSSNALQQSLLTVY